MRNFDDIGKTRWVIAEGWLPPKGPHPERRALASHEAACILNAGPRDAQITLIVFFGDREPAGPFNLTVPAQRVLHLRFDDLAEPEPLPLETDFASIIDSDEPIIVQHTRLDMRTGSPALMSTIAFGAS